MGLRTLIFIVFCLCELSYCTSKSEANLVEEIVQKYDTTDFEQYTNLLLIVRERGWLETTYVLSTVTSPNKTMTENIIYKSNYTKGISYEADTALYLSEEKVEKIISDFQELNFTYLAVDSSSNVYISPISFERPYLMRLADRENVQEHINVHGLPFSHYRGCWYIYDFYK